MRRFFVSLCSVVLSLPAWGGPRPSLPDGEPRCMSRGVGLDSRCLVNGVNLHFVDWGGTGGDLVLVAGLDDSARVYDELAALLRRHHRVIGVTRRGFCGSDIPPDGYSADNLAKDFREFLDAVGVEKADIVGHSMAGLELTHLAVDAPDKVRRLVYLDAATDKSPLQGLWQKDPVGNGSPPPEALSSWTTLIGWTQQLLKSHSPAIAANLHQCFVAVPGGLRFRSPKGVDAAVMSTMVSDHPDYGPIRAPALAIYSDYRQADQVPPGASAELRAKADAYSMAVVVPWEALEKARFRLEIQCGRTIELTHAGHYAFLERPREIAASIESFLASDSPCNGAPSH
jgi:non-heme chloroperoxidase